MSVKHVKEYYNQIYKDFHEMNELLKYMSKEFEEGLVSDDQLENLKKTIEPIKNNFARVQYIMYLLDQPNKKEKQKKYEIQNKKILENSVTLEQIKEEDADTLEKLKKVLKE